MNHLRSCFAKADRILVFDTETTGLWPSRDSIIQFSGVVLEPDGENVKISRTYNELIALAPGEEVPPRIQELTGITTEAVRERGIPRDRACREIAELISGNTLLAAYNAQFDLTFLYHMLRRDGNPFLLQSKDKLDILTIYRDRRPYPHKLFHAIEAYGLSDMVRNSHSADDDALAAAWVLDAMAAERDDLLNYVNLFGYIPKFGVPKPAIRSILYRPQPYAPTEPLYR